jgi:hypothetical protein
METLSWKRFLLAGLAAGLLINVFDGILYTVVIGAEANAVLERLGLELPGTGGMVLYSLAGFAVGFVAVWLYTGMRAGLGPGPVAAGKTGLAVWAVGYLIPFLDLAIEGLYTTSMFWTAALFTAVTVPLATMGGAWVYRPGPPARPAPGAGRPLSSAERDASPAVPVHPR